MNKINTGTFSIRQSVIVTGLKKVLGYPTTIQQSAHRAGQQPQLGFPAAADIGRSALGRRALLSHFVGSNLRLKDGFFLPVQKLAVRQIVRVYRSGYRV